MRASRAITGRTRSSSPITADGSSTRTVSALRVLPDVVAACREIPVMMDGGIRRGTDVLKALALGARFVFVARPFNYAAAIAGDAGVAHAIELLGERDRPRHGDARRAQHRGDVAALPCGV